MMVGMGIVHFAPWYRNLMRMQFGEELRPLFEANQELDIRADFVPDGEARKTYLGRGFGNSYDFNQTP